VILAVIVISLIGDLRVTDPGKGSSSRRPQSRPGESTRGSAKPPVNRNGRNTSTAKSPPTHVEVTSATASLKVGEEVLTTLKKGECFRILKIKDNWYKIRKEGKAGWVHAKHVSTYHAKRPRTPKREPKPKDKTLAGVRCDKFDVTAALQGDSLRVRLDTDLPEFTELMVSVSRCYFQKGDKDSKYARDYFSEKSTVSKWRTSRSLSVADHIFDKALQKQLDMMASLGMPFEVARIEDTLEVSFVVPVNQENPAFGKMNVNLRGTMVAKKGLRTIGWERAFKKPFARRGSAPRVSTKAHYGSLKVGRSYRLSKQTPLMPEFEPSDPMAAISHMKRLPPRSSITVIRIRMKRTTPWYYVRAFGPNGLRIGEGWINSIALIRQDISVRK